MDTLSIRRVPLAEIHPDPANARLHPQRNLEAIKASLARFHQVEPLVVQKSTGRLIAGHGRVEAMRALGWTDADILEVDLDDTQAAALAIALNRSGELAEWDLPALAKLIGSLQEEFPLGDLGFNQEEFDALLDGIDAPPVEIDDPGPTEPPENPVSRVGDLWLLGDHRLLCGDSTNREHLARLMDGHQASLLASDPPYCVNYTGNDRPIHDGKPSGKDWTHVYREIDIKDLGVFLDGVFNACLPHLAPETALYIWHAHVQQPTIAAVFERHALLLHQVIVWVKPCAVFGHSYYRWRHEPCAFGWVQGDKPKHGVGQLDTVWEADWDGKARITTFHPTSKPTRLFEIPIEQHTKRGDVVLEPFSGSGSQIIAAEKLGRRCFAMEITPAFVDGTIDRWQKATGREATLDGRSFSHVRMTRSAETPAAAVAGGVSS